MAYRILSLTIIAGFMCVCISCDLISEKDRQSEYPYRIQALALDSLMQKNMEFQDKNGNHLCSTLNEYGYTGFSRVLFEGDTNPCLNREVVRVEMSEPDTVVKAAKRTLVFNSDYTGVQDTTLLEVAAVEPLFGCTICEGRDVNSVPIEWKVTFQEQILDSSTVRNTGISVYIDARGVNRIWGNWYTNISVPDFAEVGYEQARQKFVGWEFDMRGYTGEQIVYTVMERDLYETPILEYFPVRKNRDLEFRLVWKIPIAHGASSYEGWFGFVDGIDGSLVNILPRE